MLNFKNYLNQVRFPSSEVCFAYNCNGLRPGCGHINVHNFTEGRIVGTECIFKLTDINNKSREMRGNQINLLVNGLIFQQ